MMIATPAMKLVARRRIAQMNAADPATAQRAVLQRLLRAAENTRFGRDHGFSNIKDVVDYQARVPLRVFEDFWSDYWSEPFPTLTDVSWPGTISYFANTSGTTTGITKYVPLSREMVSVVRKGGLDLIYFHFLNNPRSRLLGGKTLILGGSTSLEELAPRILAGDLSGVEAHAVPFWMRGHTSPPHKIAGLPNWEERIERTVETALTQEIRVLSGSPNWILVFIDKYARRFPDRAPRLAEMFPNLELIIHGGAAFPPYAARYAELLEGSHAETREMYGASEGPFAVADRGPGEGLRMILDGGVFFEFIPTEELGSDTPRRHWIDNVELGVEYALVLSTCSGSWSYVIGDTVRFVDLSPPRILVTGRTAQTLHAFGEHVITEELEDAVLGAATAIGARVAEYSVAPVPRDAAGGWQGHHYVVEFLDEVPNPDELARFTDIVDTRLRELNLDYADQRDDNVSLDLPRVDAAPAGTFYAWMKQRGHLGGQHKVPRVINDATLFASLRDLAAVRRVET